ncbi:hypothetical protein ACJMK2_029201 [Sinanodonta woodiana]|uniref:G-protein coupled receptors family 1 profile domain-containing protein n=1 Tax=Sinanodonta woodiana TaxID=1069815 RepID=A0ABD3X9H3_SINWO
MPNFLYNGGHTFDKKNHQCIWNRSGNFTYTLLVSAVFICGPFILIGSCLLSMFAKIVASKRVVNRQCNTGNSRARKALRESISTAKTLVGIFCLFLICWTPYAIVIVIDFKDVLSQEVHLFVTLLAHAHSSANFFVYIVCSR